MVEKVSMESTEKSRIAFSSVLAAVFLTAFKLVVGLATNSLGILSEAAHSGLDLVAALMTLFAIKISARPADETHHYGHGKVEGFSAFVEVLLLLLTCAYIIYEAVERITGKAAHVDVNIYSFGVMAISIIVDISRSRALYRVARKHRSQALEADALHFSSDIWSSAVVIVGLVGYKFFGFPLADSIAALIVAVLVIVVSIRLGVRTINVLLDKVPAGVQQKIEEILSQVQGMEKLDSLRIRSAGPKTFVDMRLTLDGGLSFTEAHRIASSIEHKVSEIVPGADALVHVNPSKERSSKVLPKEEISGILSEHENLFVGYHDLNIVRQQDTYLVTMHLLMGADSHLEEAHRVCDHLERDIKQLIPGATVNIHLEPASPAGKSK
jgi:cation diffusion facilitator family transporter